MENISILRKEDYEFFDKKVFNGDKGKTFKSSLYEDAKKASGGEYDPTTFNTATDVENALKFLKEEEKESKKVTGTTTPKIVKKIKLNKLNKI